MKITPEHFADMTLESAAAGVAAGEFGAADLLAAAKARMDQFEPVINAAITRNDEAAGVRAAAIDAEGKGGPDRPLRGLPLALKDNIMVQGVRATCGSSILDNFVPPFDAAVVEKLDAAGAVVTAKTNMDEFAMGSTGETSAYGTARNPWDTTRVTGGSSSGSAAMVAYGGALAALGTDTGGSIRQPANFCGLVGMKPTYGKVSRYGVGALASSLDQVGPMTRSVRDNALLLDVISGHDRRDSTSARQEDAAKPCLPTVDNGIKGMRIGYDPTIGEREGFSAVAFGALRRAIDIARDAGAELVEITIPLIDYGVAAYYIINFCEASTNLARFDGVRYGVRRGDGDLWDVFSETRGRGFGDEVKRRIMLGSYALSKGYYDAYYLKATRVRRLFAQEFGKLMENVDAILMPAAPLPPRMLGKAAAPLEDYLGDVFTLPANLTSLPALAFPVGVFEGLPAGVQAMGGSFREDVLYRLARVVEQNTRMENAPWTRGLKEGAK